MSAETNDRDWQWLKCRMDYESVDRFDQIAKLIAPEGLKLSRTEAVKFAARFTLDRLLATTARTEGPTQ